MDTKIDRRAARTRKVLREALMALILEKGYERITVQDIIDAADVGRSTFYAHYTGKDDLLRRGFEQLRALLAEAGATPAGAIGAEPLAFSRALFEHACEYRQLYRALVGGHGGIVAVNELRRILSERVREELGTTRDDEAVPRELRVQFVVATFLTVVNWSFERRPSLPADRMDAIFRRLVIDGIGA